MKAKIKFLREEFDKFLKEKKEFENFYKHFKYNLYRPLDSKQEYFEKTASIQWITFAFNWRKAPGPKEDMKWKALDTAWKKVCRPLEKEYDEKNK